MNGIVTFMLMPILLIDSEVGCALIVVLLGLAAALRGARMLIYYAAMARYMVGGKDGFVRGGYCFWILGFLR